MVNFNTFFGKDGITPDWDFILSIPQFAAMKGSDHSTIYHMEGDVFEHTKLVVENALSLVKCNETYNDLYGITITNEWRRQALLMAALFHDIAKPVVTTFDIQKNDFTSPYHGEEGAKIARMVLMDLDYNDAEQRELIVSMVRTHMMFFHILEKDDANIRRKLFKFVTSDYNDFHCNFNDAYFLHICDCLGSLSKVETGIDRNIHIAKIHDLGNKKFDDWFSLEVQPNRINRLPKMIAQREMYGRAYESSITKIEDDSFDVFVLIGAPGVGKTTYYEKNLSQYPIISRDIARVELGYCFEGQKYLGTKEEEDEVTRYVNKKMKEYAKEQQSFVIDNTHMRQKYRDEIHKQLKDYNVRYVYVYIEAPSISETIRRREEDFGSNAKSIILRMYQNFEFPWPYEYDDMFFIKQQIS